MKSYTPLRPRALREPPVWVELAGTRELSLLHTDDTEFGPGFYRIAGNIAYFAYQRGAAWYVVTVDRNRVLRVAEASKV